MGLNGGTFTVTNDMGVERPEELESTHFDDFVHHLTALKVGNLETRCASALRNFELYSSFPYDLE